MKKSLPILLVVLGVAVLALLGSLYRIDQTQQAVVLEFGKYVKTVNEPGLHFKKPYMFQTVLKFDNRILHLDARPRDLIASESGQRIEEIQGSLEPIEGTQTADEEERAKEGGEASDSNTSRIIVDAYAKYRITDPRKFYETVKSENTLNERLDSILEANLRQVVGSYSLHALLTEQRTSIMASVRNNVNAQMKIFGIDVVDVRIKRADLPPKNYATVINRMRAEREKEAREFRAKGAEEAQIITSAADKKKAIIIANAQKEAQRTRGLGDAEATRITAAAFGRDADFYNFYRSMQAYRATLKEGDTSMVLSPDSDFLKYFGDMSGR